MRTVFNFKIAVTKVLLLLAVGAAWADCSNGREVTIPSTDSTEPRVIVEWEIPVTGGIWKGQLDSLRGQRSIELKVLSGSKVKLHAIGLDSQGLKELQLWVGVGGCSKNSADDTVASCNAPGLSGRPTRSISDPGSVGDNGCTRYDLLIDNLVPIETDLKTKYYEVGLDAINFADDSYTNKTSLSVKLVGAELPSPPPPACPLGFKCCGDITQDQKCHGRCMREQTSCPLPN